MSAIEYSGALNSAAEQKGLGTAYLRARAMRTLDLLVAFWIFTGGLVLVEPSPYEFSFLLVLPMAFIAGIGLYRSTLGILAILMVFIPFALIASFQVNYADFMDAFVFVIVTIFMFLTSYFLANYLAEATLQRTRLIIRAYTGIALICSLIGILAYLGLIPGADLFVRYGRAKATFKDPNVYGPFLILPAAFALQRVLLARGSKSFWAGMVYLVLFVGIFVSFSRAAWGHLAATSLLVMMLVFWLEANAHDKVRIMILSIVGTLGLVVALGGLLSVPAVYQLFETRTASQKYDGGSTGRFGRQGYAFDLALSNPWGIGAGEFHNLRITEEPHDTYVSVLHVYGWGGGAMYYLFVLATLWRGISSLRHQSPYRLLMIPVISTFSILVIEAAIIDIDHWRHYYLVAGMIWGLSTAIRNGPQGSSHRDEALV
ncbi:hypothetical protein PSQ90_00930 [Devosia rhodophyticola]|uniref:O-antigen ligase domain-containing protein n=1 Tax=Devosia rhodophyticola TaxID=3026423 RepID=A0ABY7YZ51_9HYPH|nr:hypothetical protein [Devosia rhodophyticola]WDR06060.1 hypothetical protein PSQ90_00930 [Devosia rhodophyticola]